MRELLKRIKTAAAALFARAQPPAAPAGGGGKPPVGYLANAKKQRGGFAKSAALFDAKKISVPQSQNLTEPKANRKAEKQSETQGKSGKNPQKIKEPEKTVEHQKKPAEQKKKKIFAEKTHAADAKAPRGIAFKPRQAPAKRGRAGGYDKREAYKAQNAVLAGADTAGLAGRGAGRYGDSTGHEPQDAAQYFGAGAAVTTARGEGTKTAQALTAARVDELLTAEYRRRARDISLQEVD